MDEMITKKQAIDAITDELDRIDHVPQWIFNRLEKAIKELPSAEEESFEWCTDCKEYDQENHCCHRWSKMIRKTVEEMKIVRCSECVSYQAEHHWCKLLDAEFSLTDFCSYAERREDG